MLQKICALFLVFFLCVSQAQLTFADTSSTQLLRAKTELAATKDGAQYIKELDILVPALDTQRLEKIQDKLDGVLETGIISEGSDTYILIQYINIIVDIELSSRVIEVTISDEEKIRAEEEIMDLQKALKGDILSSIDDIMLAWNEASRYEEKGDFEMDMMFNLDGQINTTGKISLNDYVAKTQGFDQSFVGEIEAFINATADGEELSISLTSDIDLISKEGQMYLQMKNIKYENSAEDEFLVFNISQYIEKLEELAQDNTYLAFMDDESLAAYEMLQSFSRDTLDAEIDKIFDSALLEAYSVTEEGTYLLRPTKHFCDAGKEAMSVFDPFGGKTCTENQYSNMLDEFFESGAKFEMTVGSSNSLTWSQTTSSADINATITWNNTRIQELDMIITGEGYSEGNLFTLNYVPKKHFKTHLIIDEGEVTLDAGMDIFLNKNGGIKTIAGNFDFKDGYGTVFNSKLNYKWSQLDFSLKGNSTGFNMDCWLEGRLDSTYSDLVWNCTIESSSLGYIIPNTSQLSLDMEMEYDIRSNKNNLDFSLDTYANKVKIFEMNMKNVGTRKQISEDEIEAPEKTKNIDDFIMEVYEDSYEDLYSDDYDYNFDDDYGYDDYSYYNEAEETYYYCDTYEYDEEENYDYCTKYISEEEYYEGFDDYEYEELY